MKDRLGSITSFESAKRKTARVLIYQGLELYETEIELKSLILAQIERWRDALHMQVERQRGLRSGGEWRTGE